ncbi:MAG TPA: DinB family protein [Gemmatimonadales bacterium]|nr:DinB family protein [Gemmatimonadales bacterium]
MLAALLATLDPKRGAAWHGGPTPMQALRGVSAAEARWVPARRRHSIWELVLHIAYWDYAVRRRLDPESPRDFPRSPANWPSLPQQPDERAWARDRSLLKREHDALVRVVRRVKTSRWNRHLTGRWTCGETIVGIAAHEVYHTGQIQLLKRLWSGRAR